jgi:hypothetical protein
MQAQVRIVDDWIMAIGDFPAGSADPGIEVVELTPEQEVAVLAPEPGQRVLEDDGTITILPPDTRPQQQAVFEQAEDAERLRLVNERAREDPAFAALADLALRGGTP